MEIDFLKKQREEEGVHRSKKYGVLFFIVAFLLLFFGGTLIIRHVQSTSTRPFFATLRGFVAADDIVLDGEREDRVNLLLLGMGGEGHDGSYLTDTIILVSFRPSTGDVALLSIPRDLSVPFANGEWRRVNSVNAIAEATRPGSGGDATRATLARILSIPIPYHIRVDFEGFTDLINHVGRVRVYVENRLEDPQYPILGNEYVYPIEERYEHLVIEPGWQMMDGDRALQYVRSRRALGSEGSDFARIKRQQNILVALKEKLFSWPTLVNPIRITRLLGDLREHIETNMTLIEITRIVDIAKTIEPENIRRITLSDAEDGHLVARKINDAYLLLPRDGTFREIQALTRTVLATTEERQEEKEATPRTAVTVLNGTGVPGLARTIADLLEAQGFDVLEIGNAPERPVGQTELYDFTGGKAPEQERRIQLFLDALVHENEPLPFTTEVHAAQREPDFVIILGENARIPEE